VNGVFTFFNKCGVLSAVSFPPVLRLLNLPNLHNHPNLKPCALSEALLPLPPLGSNFAAMVRARVEFFFMGRYLATTFNFKFLILN